MLCIGLFGRSTVLFSSIPVPMPIPNWKPNMPYVCLDKENFNLDGESNSGVCRPNPLKGDVLFHSGRNLHLYGYQTVLTKLL